MLVSNAQPVTWTFDPKNGYTMSMDYDTVQVPTGLPYVGKPFIAPGYHKSYQVGPGGMRLGCTMEMVSALAGERWHDHPQTAHPSLSMAMIMLNDRLPDVPRQEMLELVPRLLDTNVGIPGELEQMIRRHIKRVYQLGRFATDLDNKYLLRDSHRLLDMFDHQLGRPTRKLDDHTLTRLKTALAA